MVFRNQDDLVVLEAVVGGIVPGAEERQIMNALVAEGQANPS